MVVNIIACRHSASMNLRDTESIDITKLKDNFYWLENPCHLLPSVHVTITSNIVNHAFLSNRRYTIICINGVLIIWRIYVLFDFYKIFQRPRWVASFLSSATYMRPWTGWTLVQVNVAYSAPSRYINQCCRYVIWANGKKLKWKPSGNEK